MHISHQVTQFNNLVLITIRRKLNEGVGGTTCSPKIHLKPCSLNIFLKLQNSSVVVY